MSDKMIEPAARNHVLEITDYLLAQGAHRISGVERETPEWREEYRSILRILAHDDTSIPAPNEEEELDRECGPVAGGSGK